MNVKRLTIAVMAAAFAVGITQAQSGTWTNTAAGPFDWGTSGNWNGGTIADGADNTATLSSALTTAQVINLEAARTIGNITNSTSGNYTRAISGANTLTLDRTSGIPMIDVASSRTLIISNSIAGNDGFQKTGAGILTLAGANSFSGGVFINAGTLSATAANLGDPGNLVTFTGTGTLTFPANTTLSQGFAINAGVAGTLHAYQKTITITNSLAGSGTLNASGQGDGAGSTFIFTSTNNTFSGDIVISSASGGGYAAAVTMVSLDDTPGRRLKLGNNGNSTAIFNYGADAVVPLVLSNRQIEYAASSGILNNNATNVNCTVTVNKDLLMSVNANRTFTLGGGNIGNNTFTGAITNRTGYVTSLTKANAGKWILSGSNTYSGTTTISAGTLLIAKTHSLYKGTAASWITNNLAIASGAVLALNVGGTDEFGTSELATFLDGSHMGASSTTTGFKTGSYLGLDTSNAGGSFTPSAAIPLFGTGNKVGLDKLGTGALILNAAQSYTGNTRITAGALQATSLSNLGSSYIQLNGGVLESSGSFIRANSTTASGINFQWQSADGGGFSANGGKLTVTVGNNAATEQVWGTAVGNDKIWGTLKFGSATANSEVEVQNKIDLAAATRTVDVAAGAGGDFATLSGAIRTSSGTAGLTKTGAGTLILTGANTYNGETTISDGTLQVGNGGTSGTLGSGDVVNNAILAFNRTETLTVANPISGSGLLNQVGSGAVVLSGNNTYNGATTISGGTLIGVTGGGCPNSAVTVNNTVGCTLGVAVADNTKQWTCSSLTSAGTSATLAFGFSTAPSTTLAPLNVTGDLTFTGIPGITLDAAYLTAGTYPLIVVGGTAPAGVPSVTIIGASGTLAVGSVSWDANTLKVTLTGSSYQPLTWNNGNTGTWDINNSPAWKDSSGSTSIKYLESIIGDQVQFTDNSLSGTATVTLNTTVKPASVTVNNSAQDITISGTGGISGTTGLTKSGGKTLTLSTTNNYSGGTTLNGGTVIAAANASLGADGSTITFDGNATLATTHSAYPVFAKGVTVNSGVTASLNPGSQFYKMTFTGPLSGHGTLDFNTGAGGAGSDLTFSSDANTFTGKVMITMSGNAGGGLTVNSLADGADPIQLKGNANSSIFKLGAGTASSLLFNSRRIELNGTLAGGGTIENNNATVGNTITINTDLLVSATGNKTLTLGGSNTGANSFAGVIADGTSAVISLIKAGSGKWILSGSNTYTGATTINGGILSVATIGNGGVAGNLGQASSAAANLVLNNGTLQYTGATASTDRNFTLTAGATGTFDITTNNVTISGASTATTGALTKTGAGTLTLTGTNTYTGATTVNGGTLQITGGGRIYSTLNNNRVITINSGCTLVFDNWNWDGSFGTLWYLNGNLIVNGATLKYVGTTANASNHRGLTIGASGATLESATAGEKWTTTSQSPTYTSWARTTTGLLTLTGVGDGQIDQIIPGPGGVTKSGTGTWTLTTNNTYTGATTINDGTLLVNGSSAAGSTNTVTAGTLGGSGTIGGHVKVLAAGNLAPGSNGAGTLSIGGTLDISALAGGKLYFQLDAPTATSDKIAVTGGLTIGSGTLGLSDFNFTKLAGSPKGVYKLITSSGIIGTLDSSDLTGAVPGIFGNLTLGINGNDIELVIMPSGTLITVY